MKKDTEVIRENQGRRLQELRREVLRLVQGEFIGRTVAAENLSDGRKTEGTIVHETRDTFLIETEDNARKRLLKDQHVFEFLEGNRRIRVSGELIARRPEDRLKIKIRW